MWAPQPAQPGLSHWGQITFLHIPPRVSMPSGGCQTSAVGPLVDLFRRFLRLGVLGFGGPAAHIAMMRDEFVTRERWFDDAEFARMVGAVNLIPGPNSTELAMHIGQRRAGGRGLVVAGLAFIVPAVVIVGMIAWVHERHGANPVVVDLRWGVLPVIVAIVAHATWGLARSTLVSIVPVAVASASFGARLVGVHELVVLVAAGVAVVVAGGLGSSRTMLSPLAIVAAAASHPSLWRILTVFLEIGAVLYGSGYVLVAFLEGRIVDRLGWLDSTAVLDAIAIGQVTPGPVFSTATFVGWQLAGLAGAAVATAGIFGPSFVFVALLGRIIDWLESHPAGRRFLSGVVAASLGLMGGALVRIAEVAIIDVWTALVGAAALAGLAVKVPATRVVLAGIAVGVVHLIVF